MSKNLQEEYEKFSEFLETLQGLSGEDEMKIKQSIQVEGKEIIAAYNSAFSLRNMMSFDPEIEGETPEEVEMLNMCISVLLT